MVSYSHASKCKSPKISVSDDVSLALDIANPLKYYIPPTPSSVGDNLPDTGAPRLYY